MYRTSLNGNNHKLQPKNISKHQEWNIFEKVTGFYSLNCTVLSYILFGLHLTALHWTKKVHETHKSE